MPAIKLDNENIGGHLTPLQWQNHTSNISAKASSRPLSLILCDANAEAKATAYTTLVRPLMEFSSAAW